MVKSNITVHILKKLNKKIITRDKEKLSSQKPSSKKKILVLPKTLNNIFSMYLAGGKKIKVLQKIILSHKCHKYSLCPK